MHKFNHKVTCQICQKDFMVEKYRVSTAKYCGQKCYGESKIGIPASTKERPSVRGEKHWRWKKDRTEIKGYWKERNNPEYKQWRATIFKRDRYSCRLCGISKKGFMQADHIKEWSKYPELRYSIENGQTLCKDCHKIKTRKFFSNSSLNNEVKIC